MNNNTYYDVQPMNTAIRQHYVPSGGIRESISEHHITISSSDRQDVIQQTPFNYEIDINKFGITQLDSIQYFVIKKVSIPTKFTLEKTIETQSGDVFDMFNNLVTNTDTDQYMNSLEGTTQDANGTPVFIVHVEYTRDNNTPNNLLDWKIEGILNDDNSIVYEYDRNDVMDITNYCSYTVGTTDSKYNGQIFMNVRNSNSGIQNNYNVNTAKTISNCRPDLYSLLYFDRNHRDMNFYDTDKITLYFPKSGFLKLGRLRFSFTDSCDKELTVENLNTSRTDTICMCSRSLTNNDPRCVCNYIRHPRYYKYQNFIHLKLGCRQKHMG